jgi:hypothetical protein
MTIGTSIVLIAIGAILHWSVTAHVSGFNIQEAGMVLFIVGLVGLALSLIYTFWWANRVNRADRVDRDRTNVMGPPARGL